MNSVSLRGHGCESFGFAAIGGFAAGNIQTVWTEFSLRVPVRADTSSLRR